MRIQEDKITNGSMNGKIVYICHYNRPDLNKKPLRSVPPTKVIIESNDELPKGKKIYYSKSHFVELNKKGSRTKKIHGVYDSTGFRSYQGNPLFIFDNERECKIEWNKQICECVDRIDVMINEASRMWMDERSIVANKLA